MKAPMPSLSLVIHAILLGLAGEGAANNKDTEELRENIRVEDIRSHQQRLQDIAESNGGNRVAIGSGYRESVAYVRDRLGDAGYQVSLQDFSIRLQEDITPPELEVRTPQQHRFLEEIDFSTMIGQGLKDVSAVVEAIDLTIPSLAPNDSTSGCEPSDFFSFTAGNIALIQRGSCTFAVKVKNAVEAGASSAIIFNEGNPDRTDNFTSRLPEELSSIPVLSASFSVGKQLAGEKKNGPTGVIARVMVNVQTRPYAVQNVITELAGANPDRVIVAGAHLDSVRHGPGLNDNGSGSATILQIALKLKELGMATNNTLRFIWFGAEEYGLLGSEFYIKSLMSSERERILGMLNFDMLGPSNYVRFVYDGDNSSESNSQTPLFGSAYIEKVFLDYFAEAGLLSHPTSFDGRSDYGPFIEVGIPAGGLFSGAEGIKSRRLAEIYGGQAGRPFDPCYHRSCDDFAHTGGNDNYRLAEKSLDELSDAAAHAVLTLANTTKAIRPPPGAEISGPEPRFEYKGNYLLR